MWERNPESVDNRESLKSFIKHENKSYQIEYRYTFVVFLWAPSPSNLIIYSLIFRLVHHHSQWCEKKESGKDKTKRKQSTNTFFGVLNDSNQIVLSVSYAFTTLFLTFMPGLCMRVIRNPCIKEFFHLIRLRSAIHGWWFDSGTFYHLLKLQLRQKREAESLPFRWRHMRLALLKPWNEQLNLYFNFISLMTDFDVKTDDNSSWMQVSLHKIFMLLRQETFVDACIVAQQHHFQWGKKFLPKLLPSEKVLEFDMKSFAIASNFPLRRCFQNHFSLFGLLDELS